VISDFLMSDVNNQIPLQKCKGIFVFKSIQLLFKSLF
jgi:hypothetical protein